MDEYPSSERIPLKNCPALGAPYLKLDNFIEGTRFIVKARCKRWTCPYCSQVNKHQHYVRILNGTNELFNSGRSIGFVTITAHEKCRGFQKSKWNFQRSWKPLSQRARRKALRDFNVSFEFVYIPEVHSDGTLHWHGLFSPYFSTRWWKDNARACGLGYQAKSVKLDTGIQATNYCLKYISKHVGQTIDSKNFRRVNYSRGFPVKPRSRQTIGFEIVDSKTSLVELIYEAWEQYDLDVKLHGHLITEIVSS